MEPLSPRDGSLISICITREIIGDGLECSVLTAREQNILLIDAHSVDYGIVALKVLHESSLGTLPLLDTSRAATGEGELGGMRRQRAHALFVMCQHTHRFAGRQVPQSDCRVERACDDLGVGFLTY